MSEELKSCPFCGSPEGTKPETVYLWQAFDLPVTNENAYDIVVRCEYCGAVGEACSYKNQATEAWNTRKGAQP